MKPITPATTNPKSEIRNPQLENSPFLKACRREPVPYTPIWIMRQAGRYMPEYRAVREKVTFLELCHRPELATEVTVTAATRLGVDAAIIFSDILVLVEPMGVGLEFEKGEGPIIHNPVRTGADVKRLLDYRTDDVLSFVYQAIRMTRAALPPAMPLIGFSGAPFTLASYVIEGGSSKNFIHTKSLMYREPDSWHELMSLLARKVSEHLNEQIAAGAQVVQLFDSWAGCLSPGDYREFALPHTRRAIEQIAPGVPVILFGTETTSLLEMFRDTGADVIGLDWRVDLRESWNLLGVDVGVQGNLDPVALFAGRKEIERRAQRVLDAAANQPGHIFNLGHGVLPETPVDNVIALVDYIHEASRRKSAES